MRDDRVFQTSTITSGMFITAMAANRSRLIAAATIGQTITGDRDGRSLPPFLASSA